MKVKAGQDVVTVNASNSLIKILKGVSKKATALSLILRGSVVLLLSNNKCIPADSNDERALFYPLRIDKQNVKAGELVDWITLEGQHKTVNRLTIDAPVFLSESGQVSSFQNGKISAAIGVATTLHTFNAGDGQRMPVH